MPNHIKSATAINVRLVAMLSLIKAIYPARLSVSELQDALASVGHPYSRRSIERHLVGFAATGLVEGDGEAPQGWRLTQVGKEFLGVQS